MNRPRADQVRDAHEARIGALQLALLASARPGGSSARARRAGEAPEREQRDAGRTRPGRRRANTEAATPKTSPAISAVRSPKRRPPGRSARPARSWRTRRRPPSRSRRRARPSRSGTSCRARRCWAAGMGEVAEEGDRGEPQHRGCERSSSSEPSGLARRHSNARDARAAATPAGRASRRPRWRGSSPPRSRTAGADRRAGKPAERRPEHEAGAEGDAEHAEARGALLGRS